MALARAERERAIAWAYVTKNREMIQPIFGPATVHFDVFRHRLLDADNSVSSLKHIQDGVCRVLLPEGDGPSAPYRWEYVQTKAQPGESTGTMVTITRT